jgi:hypothetical protein
MAKAKSDGERAVVVCTAKRAVVMGYTRETGDEIITRGTVTLSRARMCTYWSKETHGVVGLAAIGPQKGSRIGPEAPGMTLESITAVIDCTDKAVAAWSAEPWQ